MFHKGYSSVYSFIYFDATKRFYFVRWGDTLKVISDKTFSDHLQQHLKTVGYLQKDLAEQIGLHPKVLSRKLNGTNNAYLTEEEVWSIITALVRWKAITTQDEVFHILNLAQLELEPGSVSLKQWQTLPLKQGAKTDTFASSSLPYTSYITVPAPQYNLPAVSTPIIGREEVLTKLRHQIINGDARLITLTGSGGCGKTRLAMKVGRELISAFSHGVTFVPLASVNNPLLVPQSIMQALNIRHTPRLSGLQTLISYLHDKQLLLILDNFEHLMAAATNVSDLMAAIPGLKVLVTSRVVLNLYGENTFNVPALDYPTSASQSGVRVDTKELMRYGAVKLFVDRARAASPTFTLTPENAENVVQICARVAGLPLALELAAARIKVLPPEKLLARLSEARLSVLIGGSRDAPERHQTLRKTITWSYNLLSPSEQVWFARLGVFNGSWSLEAIQAMMQTMGIVGTTHLQQEDNSLNTGTVEESALDLLVRLMDSNFVVRLPVTGGQVRFALLEMLREYALEQLEAHGELERIGDWHAYYYMEVAEAAEIGLHGSEQLMWRARLVADRDNFRSAMVWSFQRAKDAVNIPIDSLPPSARQAAPTLPALDVALRLVAALRPYWEWQGHLVEGRRWQEAALAITLPKDAPRTTLMARGKALSEISRMVCLQNEQQRSAELAEESIALWRQLDHPEGLATALWYRGWAAHALNDHQRSKEGYEEALQLLSNSNDVWLRAQILFYLGDALGFLSDYDQMHAHYAQSLVLFEQVGDKSAIADVLKDQGGMFILQGKLARAIDNLLRSLALSYELGYKQFVANCTSLLGYAIGMREAPDPETATLQAALLWGAGEGLRTAIGSTSWLDTYPVASVIRQQILSRVSESSWQSAWQSGYALTEEQTVAACMALQHEPVAVM